MAPLDLPVIVGTVRRGNQSSGVGRYVLSRGLLRPGVSSTLYLAQDLPFANLVDREWEMSPRPPAVAAFVDAMSRADGFMIVTPEYNYGIPGTLKNLLDALYDQWGRKPFALVGVSSGLVGGARALDQLRMVVAGINGVTVPFHVLVREAQDSFKEGVPVKDPEGYAKRLDKLWGELAWYAQALKDARGAAPK